MKLFIQINKPLMQAYDLIIVFYNKYVINKP